MRTTLHPLRRRIIVENAHSFAFFFFLPPKMKHASLSFSVFRYRLNTLSYSFSLSFLSFFFSR